MKKNTNYVRSWRQRHPIKNAYQRLKSHAKERGIAFSLTWEYFYHWCLDTRYHEICGRGKNDATIDRIDHTKGYEDGNIQILSNSNNVKKQHAERCKPWFSIEDDEQYNTINPF